MASKDPAFLFYPSDFIMGTIRMTDEQVGKYIKLLCIQHSKGGYLEEEDIDFVLPTKDKIIIKKFKKNENGYYNERLLEEMLKRKSYSESRRNNRKGSKKKDMSNICKTHVKHMENKDEDINTNKDITLIVNKESLPYQEIANYWNDNSELQSIRKLTDKRKAFINARFKEYGLDEIKNMIDNVAKSPFLKGENNRKWVADFEWCFKPNNFIKILEGNYLENKNGYVKETEMQRRLRKLKEATEGTNG